MQLHDCTGTGLASYLFRAAFPTSKLCTLFATCAMTSTYAFALTLASQYCRIADPEASKPDDWDEDAPREILDEEAEKPEGWLDDEPEEIDDPGQLHMVKLFLLSCMCKLREGFHMHETSLPQFMHASSMYAIFPSSWTAELVPDFPILSWPLLITYVVHPCDLFSGCCTLHVFHELSMSGSCAERTTWIKQKGGQPGDHCDALRQTSL